MATHTTVKNFLRVLSEHPRLSRDALVNVPHELHDFARHIGTISGTWNPVSLFTADNVLTEKKKFLEAFDLKEMYCPQFTYKTAFDTAEPRRTLAAIRKDLEAFSVTGDWVATWVRALLIEKVINDQRTCDLADGISGRSHGGFAAEQLVSSAFALTYWPLDDELLAEAEADCERRSRPGMNFGNRPGRLTEREKEYLNGRMMTSEEVKAAFEWALAKYNLLWRKPGDPGFKVIIDPKATAIDVRHRATDGPTVVVTTDENRNEAVTARDLVLLMRHEIEAHARQSRNGWLMFGFWGGVVTENDETMYEGLAMDLENGYLEELFGSEEQVRPYPYVYPTAVKVAMDGGTFHDVFADQLTRYIRTELKLPANMPVPKPSEMDASVWNAARNAAWRAAYRVMRGHKDTKNAGMFCMPKDLAYTRGERIHQDLVKTGYGHYNEIGIIPNQQGLYDLARFDLEPDDVPLKDLRVTDEYLAKLLADMPA